MTSEITDSEYKKEFCTDLKKGGGGAKATACKQVT